MFQIVIASHGPLAEAMKNSLQIFYPELSEVYTANIDEDGLSKFQEKMDDVFAKVKNKDVLIFTDLLYGSPFNEAGKRVSTLEKDFDIISGVNMPILVEAVNLQKQNKELRKILPALIDAGAVQSYKEKLKTTQQSDDDE
ncbi:PTS sugar transporter subunit IIA [Tetragenococcus koreensis]|uniref:PTS fructose transporter subunit IIA n=1 Tax=Tetragenococcus koreensis TaxID=290335 RepID=A0AAN4RKB6_9ENTE|nr:hypothetical protein [Tetragenococcus koreensis]MDN6640502.1 hypothetical protein [Tetragenococcus sp.]MCF1616338.1 hypothetical protein [Tetragenococcus koreensis]MCF1621251.1 hypothetical protein [Tetragenococcus koreensis]MCF1626718.1 hypothetical protein [Tetragenococcus koreensis]MCF1631856.1 hypothetical protein [Tetragenococcus koreensis]